MGYLICDKCKKYYKLKQGESAADFTDDCDCGGKLRYAENIDIIDPKWKQAPINDICPKCGAKNPSGAAFCAICGSNMKIEPKQTQSSRKTQTQSSAGGIMDWWNKQSTNRKAGIAGVCCLGLLLIVGVVALSPDKNTNTSTTTTNTPSNTPSTTTAQAAWHSVATFSGTGDKNTPSFSIKGNKFKVKITATAAINATQYASIHFFAYPEGETQSYDGQGSIPNFSQSTMTDEFEVTSSSGNYYLKVGAANLSNWKIEVSDYY